MRYRDPPGGLPDPQMPPTNAGGALGLMGRVARGRLRYLTDAEIAHLYGYLRTLNGPS